MHARPTTKGVSGTAVPERRPACPAVRRVGRRGLALGAAVGIAIGCLPRAGAGAEGDPSIGFVRFLGGQVEDTVRDVAIDADGNVIAVGGTGSPDFPTTPGAFDRSLDPGSDGASFGAHDVWVAKLAPDGRLLWSTLIGGPGYDRAYAVEVADDGIVVAGRAGPGFPTTSGALQTQFAGDAPNPNPGYGRQDGFVLKLSRNGDRLLWSTYFGDPGRSFLRDVDLDANGRVYLVATQVQTDSPYVTAGAFDTSRPPGDAAVVARLSANGRAVQWATYLGGSGSSLANPSIRVNAVGEVFVMGETSADGYPIANAVQPQRAGLRDITVTGLTSSGGGLLFSTYLGGVGEELTETHGLAIGPGGDVYVAAATASAGFPVTTGAAQTDYGGGPRGDAFVARFSRLGVLRSATFLGGTDSDGVEGIGVDGQGRVWITGFTASDDFPTTADAFHAGRAGAEDWFVARLTPALDALDFSSLFGGGAADFGRAAMVTEDGDVVAGGQTESDDWPATDGSEYASTGFGYAARDAALVFLQVEKALEPPPGACANGIDDDGDGAVDFPADPGCRNANDASEHGPAACDDGVDNDADGFADYPGDAECTGPADPSESVAPDDLACGPFCADLDGRTKTRTRRFGKLAGPLSGVLDLSDDGRFVWVDDGGETWGGRIRKTDRRGRRFVLEWDDEAADALLARLAEGSGLSIERRGRLETRAVLSHGGGKAALRGRVKVRVSDGDRKEKSTWKWKLAGPVIDLP